MTPNTLFGLFPCFTLSQGLLLNLGNLSCLLGTACFTLRFGGVREHLFQLFRLLKLPLPGILLHFSRFGIRFSSRVLIARTLWTWSSPPPSTVSIVPCGDYSAEQSINQRHLHSALQPAGELRGRLWNGGGRG